MTMTHSNIRSALWTAGLSLTVWALSTGCSSSGAALSENGYGSYDAGAATGCYQNSDCPTGLVCVNSTCVSPADNKPPEQKTPVAGPPPAATPHDLFTLAPSDGLAIRISAKDLSIEAIAVGGTPSTVVAFPGLDRALVLNPGNAQLQILDATGATPPTQLLNIALSRHPDVLTFSPDGVWAVANTDPNTTPADGEEGVITVAYFPPANGQVELFDRAAGYRITDVFFRTAPGGATQSAVVVSKQEVAFVDLSGSSPPALPPRLALPASAAADLGARNVVATSDGRFVFIRSFTAPQITAIDVDLQQIQTLTLSDIPTDLQASPSGDSLVAVLRATATIAIFALPGGLADGGSPTLIDAGFNAGQISFPPAGDGGTGSFGLLYTNADPSFDLGRLDLASNTITYYPNAVQKLIQAVGIAPDGKSAVVVHRPDPNPTQTDPYDRAVAADQGYSMFDMASTTAQLRRTNGVPVSAFAFLPQGSWASVALRDDSHNAYSIDAIDLSTLLIGNVGLASPPDFIGALPPSPGTDPKVWITQAFNGGRVSFLDLPNQALQTVTGFELNSLIQN
jgi:hypothetical protein